MHPNPSRHLSTISSILRPWWVKVGLIVAGVPTALGFYDAASNQFGLPLLPALAAKFAGVIPTWGWFILLQYAVLGAVIDYLRRQRRYQEAPLIGMDPRLDEFVDRQKAIIDDYQRMLAIEDRFDGEIDGIKTALQRSEEGPTMHLKVLERRIGVLEAVPAKLEENRVSIAIHTKEFEKLDAKIEHASMRCQESFSALYSREQLDSCENEMTEIAGILYDRLAAGETYSVEEWESWRIRLSFWESSLSQWISVARWYAPDVERRVTSIDEKKYAGPWTVKDEQIPNAEGTRQFRKFRILHHQWEEVRNDVRAGLIQVAYVGLSEKDAQTRPPKAF